jgi:hypothetical protein
LFAPHRDEENPDVHTNHTFPEQDNARCDSLSLKRFAIDSEVHQEFVYSEHMFLEGHYKNQKLQAHQLSHTPQKIKKSAKVWTRINEDGQFICEASD